MVSNLWNFFKKKHGGALTEYILIVILITVALITVTKFYQRKIELVFQKGLNSTVTAIQHTKSGYPVR
jgi:Flp pilus assembly pilin Flp